jgi:tetratricopeptide (TPR) repeat protein/transglutaminase-like putative cysteine protease
MRATRLLYTAFLVAVTFPAFSADTGWYQAGPWETAPFSADLDAYRKAASAVHDPDAQSATVLFCDGHDTFLADGSLETRSLLVYRVENADGVKNWSDTTVTWYPWFQDSPKLRVRIVNPDSTVITLSEKDLIEVSTGKEGDQVYDDRKTLKVPYPHVTVGSLIEEEITTRSRPYLPGTGVQSRWSFGRSYSVGLNRYTVGSQTGAPLTIKTSFDAQPVVSDRGSMRFQTWEFRNQPARKDAENFAPPEARQRPVIDVSSAPSWSKIAAAYGAEIDKVLAKDAFRLPAELPSSLDVKTFVVKASRWINTKVRYTGLELGQNSILPFSPATVLSRGYGDCKDKATLLVALLRAAGHKAWVSLIYMGPGWDVDPAVTGMMDFDHAIVYVDEGSFWFDPTVELSRTTELPYYDQYRRTLVARAETSDLSLTPQAKAEDNLVFETREITMKDQGRGSVREVTEYSAALDSYYRNQGLFTDPKETKKQLTDYAKEYYGSTAVTEAFETDPHDTAKLYGATLVCDGISQAQTDDTRATVSVHLNNLRNFIPNVLLSDDDPKRVSAFRYNLPFSYGMKVVVHPPAGFKASGLPDPVQVDNPWFSLSRTWSQDDDGTLHATVSFATKQMQLSADEFAKARGLMRTYLGDQSAQSVQLELEAESLRAEGRYAEAFQSYRSLLDRNPSSAIQNKRLSVALMSYSLGQPAVHYAKRATELDPKNAALWANLANMLANDGLGRRLNPGYDRDGSIAAWKRAVELDPTDTSYQANLGILYQYDERGMPSHDAASLQLARDEYVGLGKALADYGLVFNLWNVHVRLGDVAAARALIPSLTDDIQRNLALAVVQVLEGSKVPPAKMLEPALTLDKKQNAWVGAADSLVALGRYQDAARMLRQAAVANADAAAIESRADTLDHIHTFDAPSFPDTPTGAIQKFLFDYLGKTLPLDGLFHKHFSRTFLANQALWGTDALGESLDDTLRPDIGEGSPQFLVDYALSVLHYEVTGDDTLGYRVTAGVEGGNPYNFFVLRENGTYKIASWLPLYSGLARQALIDLDAGQNDRAARWFEWMFPTAKQKQGPLSWDFFDDDRVPRSPWLMRLVSTEVCLLGDGKDDAKKLIDALWAKLSRRDQFLAEARSQGVPTDLAPDLWLSLAFNLGDSAVRVGIFDQGRRIGDALAPFADGDTFVPLHARWVALSGDGPAAETMIEKYRNARPDDRQAFSDLLTIYQITLNFAKLDAESAKYPSRLSAIELNNLAWDDLFRQPTGTPPPLALERSRKSVALGSAPGDRASLHTLATIYATVGRYDEALSVLNKALSRNAGHEPTRDDWYVVGLIADGYGFHDAAREAWQKVTPPDVTSYSKTDTYVLAQARLAQ